MKNKIEIGNENIEVTDPKMVDEIKTMIRNNIGVKRWAFFKKQGAKIILSHEKNIYNVDLYNIVTSKNNYIGMLNLQTKYQQTVQFIYSHRLTNLGSVGAEGGAVSLGYSEKEKAWYCFSHRGNAKFEIGYQVKKGSTLDKDPHPYPYTAKTNEECQQLAIEYHRAFNYISQK